MKRFLQQHRVALFLIKVLVLYLGFCSQAMAQQIIQGKVTDEKKEPIPGVNIVVKNTTRSTITDTDGSYKIEAKKNEVLLFTSVGFAAKSITVDGNASINAVMELDNKALNEVIVVSYGKQSKKNLLGSVSDVKASAVKDIPGGAIGQKLQGRVAGLQVSQTTGRPGQGMTFRIRGAASLGSGNQPLFVVDGQPVAGDINLLNPDDIESFSVLKDASAAALYGSRAANGVIMITTKHAKSGVSSITFNAYYGSQTVPERGRPDLMNANEFATYLKGVYEDKIRYENYKYPKTGLAEVPDEYKDPSKYGEGTDWYDTLLRTAPVQNYSLNISTGTDKVLSSNSLTYFKQEGVLINTGLDRISLRSNNEYRPNSFLKLGVNIAPSFQTDYNTGNAYGALSQDGNRQIISGALTGSPLISPVNPDGTYPQTSSSFGMYPLPNYYQQLQILHSKVYSFNALSNIFADFKIIDGLNFRTTLNLDVGFYDSNAYRPTTFGIFGAPGPGVASAYNSSGNYTSWLSENMITYNKKINAHNFDFLLGYSAQKYDRNTRSITGSTFANDDVPWIVGATTTTGTSNNNAYSIVSAYSRLNYDYDGKYLVSASVRRDGSSRFGSNKKYGVFPAVSVGWIVSQEDFFPKTDNVSFLKLRTSWGITGNNNIGDYTQTAGLGVTNYVFSGTTTAGLSISQLGNPDLTWETSEQLDLGFDLNLFKNRITLSYDYYYKNNSGMLYQILVPIESGYSSVKYNVGEFAMWGEEIQLNTVNLTGAVKWNTGFNISFNDNRVLALQDNTPIGGINMYNDYNRTAVGHHIGQLYGYVFDGVYMNQAEYNSQPKYATSEVGSARMKDINGDGKIDVNDRTFIGDPNPKYQYGMTNELKFKKWDFSIAIAGQGGNQIMNTNKQNSQNLDGIFNLEKEALNGWRSVENPGNGLVPRSKASSTELYRTVNTNWVFDGDYLAIKNITLGYTFDLQKSYLKTARLYVGANQVVYFTKYPGQNPEVNDSQNNQTTSGLDNGSYPLPRTILVGANINF